MFGRFFSKKESEDEKQEEVEPEESGNHFSKLSAEKLKAVIINLNNASPIFERAGYRMEQLDVEFGTTPMLTPHFKLLEQIDDSLQEEILEELDEKQLIKFILISLFKSSRMQSLFEDSELYYHGMQIDISNVPSVRTIFKRQETMAEVIPLNPG